MKKIIIFSVLSIFLSSHLLFLPLFGHPVWGEKIILNQPNGTKIVGYIYGDEYHRRVETEEGYTIILNEEKGTIEYAALENNKLVPSGMVAGVISTSYLERINFPKHLTDRKYRIAEIRKTSPEKFHDLLPERPKTQEVKKQALEGTRKVFVVCVEFQSETSPPTQWSSGTYSPSGFNSRLFSTVSTDISMVNYYKSNSYNKFWPEGYTYPNWVTLPQTASWYKDSGSWRQIITDALDEIKNINSSFDFTQYATNGDMDLILIWAGRTMSWGDFYWPHEGVTYISRYGIRVKNYNAVNEKNSDGSENTSISAFCHEYGHMTGCPDLYDYSSFQLKPVGRYCIMGTSNYSTNFCGYLKWRNYGWVTPEEVFSNGTYSIDALGLASVSNPRLYKIDIEPPEEYLLLENRYNGADANYENLIGRSSGLLITHIDENYPAAQGWPDYTFYGVEAIVPGLDTSITTLGEYANYYNQMVFSSDTSYTRLEPAYPDDQPAGAYLTLTTGDDTEHVIYRNTQGHSASSGIYISDISSLAQTMSFTATVPSTSPAISGSVKTPSGIGIQGVTLSFSAGGGSTTTDADGNYVHSVTSGWSGTVTPSYTGNIFEPSSISYTNVTSSQLEQDYFSSSSFLKGTVTDNSSNAIEDVFVQVYTDAGSYVTYELTDNNGDYIVGGLNTGGYKIWFWPSIASGTYALEWYNDKDSLATADSVSVTTGSTTSGIDAVLANGGSIAGTVTNVLDQVLADVYVLIYNASGINVAYDFTDSSGNYEVRGLKVGSYKAKFDTTYVAGNYTSEWYNDKDSINTADSVSVTEWSVTSNINAQLSSSNPFISGAVKTSGGAGIQGVTITFSGGEGTASTDANGNYSHSVTFGWSGTATPSKAGYTFSPSSRDYTNVTSDQLDQNYTATITQHTLTITAGNGGTTDPTPNTYTHDYGTQVQVTAVPDPGYRFSGWTGDASGTTNPIAITMDADKALKANFSPISGGGGDGGGKKGCFIATAAYGSPIHPHLDILRDFRDKYLMPNEFGRKLVALYYRYSPSIANFIAKHELLKVAVRINLLPVIALSSLTVHFGPLATATVLLFMLLFPILFIRFYQRKVRILL